MPETLAQWYFFALYTVGSVGGLVFLMDKLVAMWRERKRLDREAEEHDPWEVEEQQEPVVLMPNPVTHIEPPISARSR